jgi:hypothetical protein
MCGNCTQPDPGFYPEGVQLSVIDPLVERALFLAERVGGLSAENRFVVGEARAYERKLNEAEAREAKVTCKLGYAQDDLKDYIDENIELSEKVEKLEKKLAPKKKPVAKKTVKKAKK